MERARLYLKVLLNLALIVLVVVGILVVLPKLIWLLLPFVIGGVIAFIANPMVHFLEQKLKIVRKAGSAIVIVGVIAVVIVVIYGLGYLLINQMISLMNDIPNIAVSLERQLGQLQLRYQEIYDKLPGVLQGIVDRILIGIQEGLRRQSFGGYGIPTISNAGDFAQNMMDLGMVVVTSVMSAYFFIAQRDEIAVVVKRYASTGVIKGYQVAIRNIKAVFGGYIKAQLKLMIILAGIMTIGFFIMHIEYAFLLALLIAFLDFLPVLGTGVVLWPWAVIELMNGRAPQTISILVIYLVCQIVKQVLEPKLVGDSIGVHPLETLFFMFVGYRIYGVIGMVIGIPVGMLLVKVIKLGLFDNLLKGVRELVRETNQFRKF